MDGLIIKKKWLDLIVSGRKTIEIRGFDTHKINEPIYLLESGSHRIRAICKIKSSTSITNDKWDKYKNNACLDMTFADLNKWYKTAYAWEITDIKPIEYICHYIHPRGAVIWVKNVESVDRIEE